MISRQGSENVPFLANQPLETTASVSAARRLARLALSLRAGTLLPAVTAAVERCLVDMFACSLASGDLPWSRQAVGILCPSAGMPDSTVIGTTLRASAQDAAFANGVQAHGLVQEDMHPPSTSHIGVVVLPAALAVAESCACTGSQLIEAVVAGYEAMGRLGRVLINGENARVFRPTGMLGPVGAAVAASLLLGLDEDATVNAIGIAGNQAVGLNQWPNTGTSEVFFHAGFAARNGVASAMLARLGATGAESILDGISGMGVAYGAKASFDTLIPQDRGPLEILNIYHKPAPACNFAQTACQVALDLIRDRCVSAEQIAAVKVSLPHAAARYPGCDHTGPFSSSLQAKTSIQFCVASAFVRGRIDEQNFRVLDDPGIGELARQIVLNVDPALSSAFPQRQGATLEVRLLDGSIRTAHRDELEPLTPKGVRQRFLDAASQSLGLERARMVEHKVASLAEVQDVGDLMRLLAPG